LERRIPVQGHVADAVTGQPVAATLTYLGIPFPNGETNGSDERWGRYHAFLPTGVYALEFAAAGYQSRYCVVQVDVDGSQVLDVLMAPMVGSNSKADSSSD
jgi:hypothetical protein